MTFNKRILVFIIFFSIFSLEVLSYRYNIEILFMFTYLILFFSSIFFGYLSKNQPLSALFGFFVHPVNLICVGLASSELAFNVNAVSSYLFSYLQTSPLFLTAVLNAAIGWLMASDTDEQDKQTGRYMAAAFLFMFYFMIMFGFFTPN